MGYILERNKVHLEYYVLVVSIEYHGSFMQTK